jgi:hypothetical protein
VQTLTEALEGHNEILGKARMLANSVTAAAPDEFDAKSQRWQRGETGGRVRDWIERWEIMLDDVDLEITGPLTDIGADEHGDEIEGTPARPRD